MPETTVSGTPRPMVIFDLDGTLWDCTDLSLEAWNRVLQDAGEKLRISRENLQRNFGKPSPDFETALLPGMAQRRRDRLADRVFALELELIPEGFGTLYPEVEETLAVLNRRYDLAIASNCQEGYIEAFLDRFFLSPLFRDWESSGRTGRTKGKNVSSILERTESSGSHLVGDTESDMKAARVNDLSFIHAAYGYGRSLSNGVSIRSFPELIDILHGE